MFAREKDVERKMNVRKFVSEHPSVIGIVIGAIILVVIALTIATTKPP